MQIDHHLRKLFKNIFGSAASRLINLLIALALVPLTINSLPPLDYAIFSMAISVSVLAAYADLGMGLAIVNTLAGESEKNSQKKSQRAVSVVWFTLLTLSFLALVGIGFLYIWINHFLPTTDNPHYEAMLLGAACVFAGLPSGLIQRILFARHRTVEANIWATGGRVLSLASVWALVNTESASLIPLTFAVIGVPVILGWLSVIAVFSRHSMKTLAPRIEHFDRRLLNPYIATGLAFLVLQLVPYAEVGIDPLLAGALISIEIVPTIDVYTKLFTYVPAIMSIALFPLWPAVSSAKQKGDIAWILEAKNWAYSLAGATSMLISISLLINANKIVKLWTNQNLELSPMALTGMAIFSILICIGSTQSIFLNGVGIVKKQAQIYIIYLLILILAKIATAATFGVTGMVWALNICCLSRIILTEKLFSTLQHNRARRSQKR